MESGSRVGSVRSCARAGETAIIAQAVHNPGGTRHRKAASGFTSERRRPAGRTMTGHECEVRPPRIQRRTEIGAGRVDPGASCADVVFVQPGAGRAECQSAGDQGGASAVDGGSSGQRWSEASAAHQVGPPGHRGGRTGDHVRQVPLAEPQSAGVHAPPVRARGAGDRRAQKTTQDQAHPGLDSAPAGLEAASIGHEAAPASAGGGVTRRGWA